jgi:hypothetical protein
MADQIRETSPLPDKTVLTDVVQVLFRLSKLLLKPKKKTIIEIRFFFMSAIRSLHLSAFISGILVMMNEKNLSISVMLPN